MLFLVPKGNNTLKQYGSLPCMVSVIIAVIYPVLALNMYMQMV